MAKFELITDLDITTQLKLKKIMAMKVALGTTGLTTMETGILAALLPYQQNRVIRWDTNAVLSAQQPNPTDNPDILEAEGATLPTGYPKFKQGAVFTLLSETGMNQYINI